MSESILMENVAKKFEKHEYGVIYLDILGQKELMKKLEAEEVNPEDEEKMQKVLKYIETFLHGLVALRGKSALEKAPILYECYIKNWLDGIDYEEIEASLKELVFGIQQFSDTTMIYVQLDGKEPFIARQLFSSLLCTLGSQLFQALKEGIFIRGGIAKGVGWVIGPDNLYGPVIHEVYTLEEKVAQWARVVVSNAVIALYKDVLYECQQEGQTNSQGFQLLKTTIVKGLDGIFQLTLFPTAILQMIAKGDEKQEEPQRTMTHFCNVINVINDELGLFREKFAVGPKKMIEISKLMLRAKMLKQEVMNGMLRFTNLCREAGTLSEGQCKEIENRVQKEMHDDMGFNTPLEVFFED